jgi:hypothetical protein
MGSLSEDFLRARQEVKEVYGREGIKSAFEEFAETGSPLKLIELSASFLRAEKKFLGMACLQAAVGNSGPLEALLADDERYIASVAASGRDDILRTMMGGAKYL